MIDVAIGVDVGGTKALALFVARDGRVLAEAQAPTPHLLSDNVGAPTAQCRDRADQRPECASGSRSERRCRSASVCPGMMRRDGRLVYAPNLRSASGADLGALLGASLASSTVFCENDANCAALCEHEWGAGARHR